METSKKVLITLTKNEVESAIINFICNCHPEYSKDYVISVFSLPVKEAKAWAVEVPVKEENK